MPAATAYAKINLALHVRARRDDGHHDLETIFAFAEDGDALSVEPAGRLSLIVDGPFGTGLGGDHDLVMRAAIALRDAAGIEEGAAIRLTKRLPVAAGLGGGSADAAAALRLLAHLWGADVPLAPIAARLGADVPACLASVTVRGDGVGDRLTPIDGAAVAGLPLLLVNRGEAMPTGPVFRGWDGVDRGPLFRGNPLNAALDGRNDLEPAAVRIAPGIATLLDWLRDRPGTRLARMSGSGATCFALYDSDAARDAALLAVREWVPGAWTLASRLR